MHGSMNLPGGPINNNPSGKINLLQHSRFFHQIHNIYTGEYRPHIQIISLQ